MPAQPRPAPSVVLVDVRAGYHPDRPVLDGCSLSLQGAGLVHLSGRNGSGKSTFLELVTGYLRPWSGSVLVGGVPAHASAARARRRACRTQPALYQDMTAVDHLAFGARCHGGPLRDQLDRAGAYGMEPWLEAPASKLSTGNARKLWLVMTTGGDFDVVVLDEPYNGLDDQGAQALTTELERWRAERQVVLVAHHLPAALAPDRVVPLAAPRPAAQDAVAGVA